MKKIYRLAMIYGVVILAVLMLRIFGVVNAGIYDGVVRWLNLAVLAYLIISFGRIPIQNFLAAQKEDLANQIQQIEAEKELITQQIKETESAIAESQKHFSELRDRIILQGEKRKEQIIAEAHQQSALMLDSAKQKVDRMMSDAITSFRSEMIDATMNLVEKQLSEIVTHEDNQKYVDRYLARITTQS